VALSGDGKVAVTGEEKPSIIPRRTVYSAILWDAASGKKLQTIRGHENVITSAVLSRDGKRIVTGSYDSRAVLREVDTDKRLQTFGGESTSGINSVALSSDGKYLVTGSHEAVLWETASGKKLQTFQGHQKEVSSVALSDGAKRVLTGSLDNTAILWDATSGKKLHTLRGHTNFVMNVGLSRDGKQPWTVSLDGTVRLWDPDTGKERCRLYSFDAGKDWLVVTPEGLFDGSEGAAKFVGYRAPGTPNLFDDEATRKRFHRPGLLAELWNEK
jgi:WD40 repeat protein